METIREIFHRKKAEIPPKKRAYKNKKKTKRSRVVVVANEKIINKRPRSIGSIVVNPFAL